MKKILIALLLCASYVSSAQAPILLDTVGNACHVDKIGFAKDNMTYTLYGDSSINLFIVGAASYQNAHYSRFRDPSGSPFANRTALTNWLDLYFFANALADSASGGGGDTATLTSVTTGSGNNITPNAIQVTGLENVELGKTSTVVLDKGGLGGLYRIDSTLGGISGSVEISNSVIALSTASSSSLNVQEETPTAASVLVSGRIQADAGINATDVAIMSQIISLGETSTTAYRGDRGKTAYDHSQLTSGTNPHNTTFANIASKPTTVSGYGITDAIVQGGQSLGVSMSIGTNDNQTLTFRANGATRASVTGAGNFIATGSIYSTNNFISNTNSITPTHSITIPSVGTGIAFYNTVDQTANYERLAITKAANVFSISTAAGGTGVVRDISINGSIFNTSGITSPKFSVSALNTAPSSASDTGTAGEIRITAGFIYVCTATNTWVRVALATW